MSTWSSSPSTTACTRRTSPFTFSVYCSKRVISNGKSWSWELSAPTAAASSPLAAATRLGCPQSGLHTPVEPGKWAKRSWMVENAERRMASRRGGWGNPRRRERELGLGGGGSAQRWSEDAIARIVIFAEPNLLPSSHRLKQFSLPCEEKKGDDSKSLNKYQVFCRLIQQHPISYVSNHNYMTAKVMSIRGVIKKMHTTLLSWNLAHANQPR